jgi:hypothetical protein
MNHRHVAGRLYVQAAFTALFPLVYLNRDGKTWLLIGLALAAGCVGLSFLVRQGHPSARSAVLGFEALAVVVGALGLVGHHYVPGSVIGALTFFAVVTSDATPKATAPEPVPAPAEPVINPALVPPQAPVPAMATVTAAPINATVDTQAAPPMPAAAPVHAPVAAPMPIPAPMPASRDILPGK